MSAIGGIIDFRSGATDFSLFDSIRKANALRGREKSVAYLDVGVSMFFNADEFAKDCQPLITERRGYKKIFLMDSLYLDAKAVFEKYICQGVDFLSLLEAPFAIALYDAERRILLLARDREGRKPLFYSINNGRICFSSEAKGILETIQDPVRINKDVLSLHLTSFLDVYGPSDIYLDVFEVLPGECILFSEVGMCRFFFRDNTAKKKMFGKNIFKEKHKSYDIYDIIEEKDVVNSLSDSLISFDIPQFHADMPRLCKLFSLLSEKRDKVFSYRDYIKNDSRRFAYDIEDRFGNFFGVLGCGIVSRKDEKYFGEIISERQNIYNILLELFSKKRADAESFLVDIMGQNKMKYLLSFLEEKNIKKEDTEFKIRILGMLCQSSEWINLRKLEIVENREFQNESF